MTLAPYLAERERIEQGATKGKWWFDFNWIGGSGPYAGVEAENYSGHFVAECRRKDQENGVANMEFIADARTAVPTLIAMVREAEAALVAAGQALHDVRARTAVVTALARLDAMATEEK